MIVARNAKSYDLRYQIRSTGTYILIFLSKTVIWCISRRFQLWEQNVNPTKLEAGPAKIGVEMVHNMLSKCLSPAVIQWHAHFSTIFGNA